MHTGYHFLLLSLLMHQVPCKPHSSRRVNESKTRSTSCYSSHQSSRMVGRVYHGEATTWNASWATGNCLFQEWPQPKGLGPIAISSNLWDSAAVCGACISITGPFGTHKGIVSDQCASCKADSLDLGPELWKQVSNGQNPGVLPINWEIVPCNFSTPIKFINKDGVSKDWNSVQVAGAEVPIRSLEVMPITNPGSEDIESKSWIRLTKQSNSNHFQPESGKGLGKLADLRVTCDNGKQIITKNVKLDRPTNTTDAVGNC
ncbi:hypothetical protein Pst134EA_022611 [Puccinia striiformis f. sp. tritici]|uniref:hypothetical protein n=1 Tax=Puccinia striiformis f. sp. tritici TaxID=168172 RepID=UPI002008A1AF|nr:hypothetical protein Pst134EA_022611 [Puccinia striiformis f. sp. tritici]KAH9445662.1 hypothetical protein Pst134EB_023500 [Puccinia striiformis f. sp. tritici]KAH9455133.1 hypothetical protein Pst134EA_022611 [Puccinia striiformis f. sp. tritici]KAI9611320.1 hypothetical protein KEM48_004562 [Puccinia striiformis f. sp. tritici PST-130]